MKHNLGFLGLLALAGGLPTHEAPRSTVSPRAPREIDQDMRDELLSRMAALKEQQPKLNRKARRKLAQKQLRTQ